MWRIQNYRSVLIAAGCAAFLILFPLAFIHYEIDVDEAWLGQQVHAYLNRGAVYSDFFRDMPPLEGRIVLYHTLLIWSGAAAAKVAGWGLYALRLVPLLSGLALLVVLLFYRANNSPRYVSLGAVLGLAFTPLFFKHMIIFRPEALVILLGFISFLLLCEGESRRALWLIVLSGVFAGLAGLAHAAGLAFALAGATVLLLHRQYFAAVCFAACSVLAFLPYVSGYFTDHELFLRQAFENRLLQSDLSMSWWQPLPNLLDEHKRWFRKPEVIGISVLFTLALLQVRRAEFDRNRIFWQYLTALAAALAIAPLPKTTRYMLPLVPFFAIVVAGVWFRTERDSRSWARWARLAFACWSVAFFAAGLAELGKQALSRHDDQIATNHRLAMQMAPGSLVMAPFDFIFEEQPNFTIQSFRGAKLAADTSGSAEYLQAYAESLGAGYLILSPDEIRDFNLDESDPPRSLSRFTCLASLRDEKRWLVMTSAARKWAVPESNQ